MYGFATEIRLSAIGYTYSLSTSTYSSGDTSRVNSRRISNSCSIETMSNHNNNEMSHITTYCIGPISSWVGQGMMMQSRHSRLHKWYFPHRRAVLRSPRGSSLCRCPFVPADLNSAIHRIISHSACAKKDSWSTRWCLPRPLPNGHRRQDLSSKISIKLRRRSYLRSHLLCLLRPRLM